LGGQSLCPNLAPASSVVLLDPHLQLADRFTPLILMVASPASAQAKYTVAHPHL
tara:strand:- start:1052 stop:1213 length:162 start_codon:yes stop_codon:yes gene_type:complete